MAKKTKAVMGRPQHVPSEGNRAMVRILVAAGLTHEEIATHLRINRKTLTKHYPEDLETGWIGKMHDAAQTVFDEMTSKTSEKRLDAAKFFLSRRGRGLWSEQKNVEISGPNGGAIPVAPIDLNTIDVDDLEVVYEILAPALLSGPVIDAELEDDDGDADEA